jgi:transposase InsO family protein
LKEQTKIGDHRSMKFYLLRLNLLGDLLHLVIFTLRAKSSLAAEKLFLRKQLAFYQERGIKPRRASQSTRLTLRWLSRWFDWRRALTVVTPRTFIGWHRQGLQLYWRRKCTAGRPQIPLELRHLIRTMARENPSWGEERIANELRLKLGLRVSPRTIRKYLPKSPAAPRGGPRRDQRWATFLKNHAAAIIAYDFCVAASATFQMLYVFVVLEHASRRIIHLNVTAHPTAAWTLQQLREAIRSDHTYRFILHDRDAIFSREFDNSVEHLGLEVLKTPVPSPQANALCERLIGTLRRECLDWMIPLSEQHLGKTLRSWLLHYNRGRSHSSLGPALPEPPLHLPVNLQRQRHRFDQQSRVMACSVLNGLHHEYGFLARAA